MSTFTTVFLIAAIVILALIICAALVFARATALPRRMTLDGEIEWEKEHGLWGDFDSYDRDSFTVRGKDGYQLNGEYIGAAEESKKYVILSHGHTSNRYGSAKYVSCYRNLGFNCIIYDERGHGANIRVPVSLGQFESEDILSVIDYVHERFGNDILMGLHGESMGSSVSLSVLKYRPDVKFVVADCGFSNLYDLMASTFASFHFKWLTPLVNFVMRNRYGFDMRDTSPIDALKQNQVPVCFIHGGADSFINPSNSEAMSEAQSGYSEVHVIPGAEHAQSREVAGEEEYRNIIAGFLKTIGFPESI